MTSHSRWLPQFYSMSVQATGTCLPPPKGGQHSGLCWTPVQQRPLRPEALGSSASSDAHHAAINLHSVHVDALGGRFCLQPLETGGEAGCPQATSLCMCQFQPRPKLDACQGLGSGRPQPKCLLLTREMKPRALTRQQPNWSANAGCEGTSSCALSSTDGPRAAPASCGRPAPPLEESSSSRGYVMC